MHEIHGQWWIEGEEERYAGTLKIHESRIELHLNHGVSSRDIWRYRKTRIIDILGEASNGQFISLLNCIERSVSQGQNGQIISEIECSEAFLGTHHTSAHPVKFSAIQITLDLGEDWIQERAYDSKGRNDCIGCDFSVLWNTKKRLLEHTTRAGKLEFFYFNTPNFLAKDFQIRSDFVIRISDKSSEKSYHEWLEAVEVYRWLLSLLYGKTMAISSVQVTDQNAKRTVSVVPPFHLSNRKRGSEPAFSYDELKSELIPLIDSWHLVAEKYQTVCKLLFDRQDSLPQRFQFLLHCQILEFLYRKGIFTKKGGRLLENFEDIYSRLLEVIKSTSDNEFIEAATHKLKAFNELPIRLQLSRFASTFHDATLDAIDFDENSQKIISDIRNDFTHVGRKSKRIYSESDVIKASYQLRFLITLYIIKEARLNERDCVYHMGRIDKFRWLVDFDRFNSPKHNWSPTDRGRSTTGKFLRISKDGLGDVGG